MKVLAFDPGAKRMGWMVLEGSRKDAKENKPPTFHGAGIFGLEREVNGKELPFQKYRLMLIDFWIKTGVHLLESYTPDKVVGEIVPAVGGGGFRGGSTQSQLAEVAITTVFVVARQRNVDVAQIGATSVKARIGGHRKATKVKVRNRVYDLVPQAKDLQVTYTKTAGKPVFDLSDAGGIGLTQLGYDVR